MKRSVYIVGKLIQINLEVQKQYAKNVIKSI